MKTMAGTVVKFDTKSGKGLARLDEPGPVAEVSFVRADVRGDAPGKGTHVRLGLFGPAAPGSFAVRAGFVERASPWPELPIVHTVGITSPERGVDLDDEPAALVPFDPRAFEGVTAAYPDRLVGRLTTGPVAPARARDLPAHLALLATALAPVARVALACKAGGSKAAVGATFLAGDAADIGDAPWPTHKKKAMMPLLQIGLLDAKRIGLDRQINVFVAGRPRANTNAVVKVLASKPGKRTVGATSLGERALLTVVEEATVYPNIVGLQSAYGSIDEELPLDLLRYEEVCRLTPERELRSIQSEVGDAFPNSDDLDADCVLGGFSSFAVSEGGPPLRRLATIAIARFPWLSGFPRHQKTVCVEIPADPEDEALLR